MECSLRLLATAIVLLFLISTVSADEFATTAEAPETSLLCISECGTCPTVCVSPPPPLPPQSPLIILTPPHDLSPPVNNPPPPPPPQVKPSFSPVTPAQDPRPSSPVSGQKGSPTPYYYFYTSKATHVEFVFSIWSLIVPLYFCLALWV
jgi:hypothetical protein